MTDKSNTESLAEFYVDLYRHLIEKGVEESFAQRIVLKEAKVPRIKTVQKESDMRALVENAIRKVNEEGKSKPGRVR